jgi:hypothetical protein
MEYNVLGHNIFPINTVLLSILNKNDERKYKIKYSLKKA